MKQLILPEEYNGSELYTLSKEDSHYLLRVQRKEIGYSLNFLDIKGNLYIGTIVDVTENICIVKLVDISVERKAEKEIILFQSIPKGKKIDLMIRQAVEIGVTSFYPIMAEHSIPTFKNSDDKEKKRDRWEKIIKEASQQSGTKKITTLEPLQTFSQALKQIKEPYTGLFFHQVPMENSSLHKTLSNSENSVIIVIGPEGGLSNSEVELLKKYNFTPSLLGDNILRAETATTFALGAVKMILLERDNWNIN